MSFFPNTTVKIERKTGETRSELGSVIPTITKIKTNVSVMLLKDVGYRRHAGIQYVDSGQVTVENHILTCTDFFDIKEKDMVTDLTTGKTYLVLEEPYKGELIKNIVCLLKSGVL